MVNESFSYCFMIIMDLQLKPVCCPGLFQQVQDQTLLSQCQVH